MRPGDPSGRYDATLITLTGMTTRMLIRARVLVPLAAVAVFVWVASCEPAYADDPSTGTAIYTIPPVWMPLLAGLTTSVLTALVTRLNGRPWVKALVNILMVTAATVVQDLVANGGVITDQFGNLFLVTLLTNVAAFIAVVRPNKVPEALAPDAGLG